MHREPLILPTKNYSNVIQQTSSRTCFCDLFLLDGPGPLCLLPRLYTFQEVPSQGNTHPCCVGFPQHQDLHPGGSSSHDECGRHYPSLALVPGCLFPGGSTKLGGPTIKSSIRWHNDLPIQSPATGHTGWSSSTTSIGWLTSQKYFTWFQSTMIFFLFRCMNMPTSCTTTSMELSHLTPTYMVGQDNKKTTIWAFMRELIQATECQRSFSSSCLSLALELAMASPQLPSTDWCYKNPDYIHTFYLFSIQTRSPVLYFDESQKFQLDRIHAPFTNNLGQSSNDFPIQVLQFSLDNKFGHTQKPTDEDGGNFHADHHLFHVKNFGIYNCLTDMYFDTGWKIDFKSE